MMGAENTVVVQPGQMVALRCGHRTMQKQQKKTHSNTERRIHVETT